MPKQYHPDEFRAEYGIDGPFVLYLGRREADKGWPWLVDVFAATKTRVKLVSAGAGHPDVPPRLRGRVIDVGYLTTEQRNNALGRSTGLRAAEPHGELFPDSHGVLAGRPPGARPHAGAKSSSGTARVATAAAPSPPPRSLGSTWRRFQSDPKAANQMGARGHAYVMENYQWPQVLDRMEHDIMRFARRPVSNGRASPGHQRQNVPPGTR